MLTSAVVNRIPAIFLKPVENSSIFLRPCFHPVHRFTMDPVTIAGGTVNSFHHSKSCSYLCTVVSWLIAWYPKGILFGILVRWRLCKAQPLQNNMHPTTYFLKKKRDPKKVPWKVRAPCKVSRRHMESSSYFFIPELFEWWTWYKFFCPEEIVRGRSCHWFGLRNKKKSFFWNQFLKKL